MKKHISNSYLAYLVMAMTGTVIIMVPLITGAAPTGNPPDGLITPTFSGLYVNDGTGNNLNIASTGDISNPSASPVTIRDNDGVIFTTASGRGSMSFVPNQNQSYFQNQGFVGNSMVGQPLLVRDSQGLSIVDDSGANFAFGVVPRQTVGSSQRGIYANTSIINSGSENGGAVMVNDVDGFEVADGTTGTTVFRVDASGTITNPSTTPNAPRPPIDNPIVIDDSVSITNNLKVDRSLAAGTIFSDYAVNADHVAIDNIYDRNMWGGTINVAAGLALSGKLTASEGIGTIRTYRATSGSIANGATGIVTRGCDTGVLISCGHDAANNWNVFDSYRNTNVFATPRTRCYAQARNSTGDAGTFRVVAVCLDAST